MTRRSARNIAVTELIANQANIRDSVGDVTELARSIRSEGILNALLVTEDPQHRGWLLLAGHRRLAAARQAGLSAVPCFVHHDVGSDPLAQTVLMLVENVQRKNLTPVEKAKAYGSLRDQGLNASQISRRTGIASSTISTHLSLLELDEATLEAVETGEVPATAAVAAVRQTRQDKRKAGGAAPSGRPIVLEAAWFTRSHRLARRVMALCDHTTRPKLGGNSGEGTGCGQCWEQIIAEDAKNGRRATGDGRRATGDGRRATGDGLPATASSTRPL